MLGQKSGIYLQSVPPPSQTFPDYIRQDTVIRKVENNTASGEILNFLKIFKFRPQNKTTAKTMEIFSDFPENFNNDSSY